MLPPFNVLFIIWSEVGTSQKLKRCQIKLGGDPAGKRTRFPWVSDTVSKK